MARPKEKTSFVSVPVNHGTEKSAAFESKAKQELNKVRIKVAKALESDILRLFEEEQHTDLTILNEGSDVIKAHRCILQARCRHLWQDSWVRHNADEHGNRCQTISLAGLSHKGVVDFIRQLYVVSDSGLLVEELLQSFPEVKEGCVDVTSCNDSKGAGDPCNKVVYRDMNIEDIENLASNQTDVLGNGGGKIEKSCTSVVDDLQRDQLKSNCWDTSGVNDHELCDKWDDADKACDKLETDIGCDELETDIDCDKLEPDIDCDKLETDLDCDKLETDIDCDKLEPDIDCDKLETDIYCDKLETDIYCDKLETDIDCDKLETDIYCDKLETDIDCDKLETDIYCDKLEPDIDCDNLREDFPPCAMGKEDAWNERKTKTGQQKASRKVFSPTVMQVALSTSPSSNERVCVVGEINHPSFEGGGGQDTDVVKHLVDDGQVDKATCITLNGSSLSASQLQDVDCAKTGQSWDQTEITNCVIGGDLGVDVDAQGESKRFLESSKVNVCKEMGRLSVDSDTERCEPLFYMASDLSEAIKNSYALSIPYEPCSDLGRDLLQLYLQQTNCDVCLLVDGVKFLAHKCVLASRCSYFSAMLGGRWCESDMEHIDLHGVSAQAVEQLMLFLYGGVMELSTPCDLMELFIVTDMYGVETLKSLLEFYIRKDLCHFFHKPCNACIVSAPSALVMCHSFNLEELEDRCLRWSVKYFTKIWSNKSFANLPEAVHQKCVESVLSNMTEKSVVDVILECSRLSKSLPRIKWTESILYLTTQLMDSAIEYTSSHFVDVIRAPEFLQWGKVSSWKSGSLEEIFNSVIDSLPVDTACSAYQTLVELKATQSDLELSDRDVLDLLESMVKRCEKFLRTHIHQVARSKQWASVGKSLQSQILENSSYIHFDQLPDPKPRPIKRPLPASLLRPRLSSTAKITMTPAVKLSPPLPLSSCHTQTSTTNRPLSRGSKGSNPPSVFPTRQPKLKVASGSTRVTTSGKTAILCQRSSVTSARSHLSSNGSPSSSALSSSSRHCASNPTTTTVTKPTANKSRPPPSTSPSQQSKPKETTSKFLKKNKDKTNNISSQLSSSPKPAPESKRKVHNSPASSKVPVKTTHGGRPAGGGGSYSIGGKEIFESGQKCSGMVNNLSSERACSSVCQIEGDCDTLVVDGLIQQKQVVEGDERERDAVSNVMDGLNNHEKVVEGDECESHGENNVMDGLNNHEKVVEGDECESHGENNVMDGLNNHEKVVEGDECESHGENNVMDGLNKHEKVVEGDECESHGENNVMDGLNKGEKVVEGDECESHGENNVMDGLNKGEKVVEGDECESHGENNVMDGLNKGEKVVEGDECESHGENNVMDGLNKQGEVVEVDECERHAENNIMDGLNKQGEVVEGNECERDAENNVMDGLNKQEEVVKESVHERDGENNVFDGMNKQKAL